MTEDQVLHVDDITSGPSLHHLLVSLSFEQEFEGPKQIPITFGLKKGIWAVEGAKIGGGGNYEQVIITGMVRHTNTFNIWKLFGVVYNEETFTKLLAIDAKQELFNADVRFEAYYDVHKRDGTICFGIVPVSEYGVLIRTLPRWE